MSNNCPALLGPKLSDGPPFSTIIRRECLDHLIAFNAAHLRRVLREWICHYNARRPHRSLGPGVPDRVRQNPNACNQAGQSQRASQVIAKPILGGLHHEYRWDAAA
jgi:putative transposase